MNLSMILLFIIGIAVLIAIVFRLHTNRTLLTERFITSSPDTLTSPNFITENQELVSRNKKFSAGIDSAKGELVIKDSGDILWRVGPMSDEQVSRRAQFKVVLSLSVTDTGNIVLWYGRPGGLTNQYWTSNTTSTQPRPPYKLAMQDDRNLVLYDGAGKVTWSSGTNIAITSWKSPRCLQANECVYDTTNKYRACHLPDGGFAVQDASGSDTVWSSRPKRNGEWKLRDFGPRFCPPGTRHDTSSGECWVDTYGRGVGEVIDPNKLSFAYGGPGEPWSKRKAIPTATPKEKRKSIPTATPLGSYGRGVGKPLPCRSGWEQSGLLCYPKCRDGYKGKGPVCWRKSCADDEEERTLGLCYKKCEPGWNRTADLTACWKSECGPDEEERTPGLCYKKCDPGWHRTADLTACWKEGCDPDQEKSGALCYKRCPEGSSRVLDRCWPKNPCKPGQEKWGAMCYPKCRDGFKPVGCCMCQPKGGPRRVAYETHCKPDEYYQGNKCAYFQVTERPPIEGSSKTCLQEDGNLVSYDSAGKSYWSSGSMQATPNGPYEGKITKERAFAVTDADGQEIWKTDTLLPDATDDFAVPRDTDMPGIGACTARAGNKGQCCAGIMCKGGALFDYCATCYTPDGRPSVNGCYGYGPDSMWLNPAFETCKGCMMLDGGRRMGCWCNQSTDPLSPPWRTQWTEISLDPDKMVKCTGAQGNRVLNNVNGELKLECSSKAADKKTADKWVDTKGFTDFLQMALDPGGEADRRIRTAKLFDKDTTSYLPNANHAPSYKVTPIMRKGQNGEPCWWVNAAGKTINECRLCYDEKGQPSDKCPVKNMYGECAGCTWDGNTLGCWCLTGRDMYSTEWRTVSRDETYNKIDASAAHVPVATSTWDRRLQWVSSLAGSKVPLNNGQTACVAHDKNAQCKAVGNASIKCDFGDGLDSPEYEVPPACRDSKVYPNANVRVDRAENPDKYTCDTSGYADVSADSLEFGSGIVAKCSDQLTIPLGASSAPPPPSDTAPHDEQAVCALPDGWCGHAGARLQATDCLGNGVKGDFICEDNAGNRGTIMRSNDCAAKWPDATGCLTPPAIETPAVCPLPDGWCTHEGATLETVDCLGGGINGDHICHDNKGNSRHTILRSDKCAAVGPRAQGCTRAVFVTGGATLVSPNYLMQNVYLTSSVGHKFGLRDDGEILVTNAAGKVTWFSSTAVQIKNFSTPLVPPLFLAMWFQGSLIARDRTGRVFWQARSNGRPTGGKGVGPYKVVMQDDGNVVMYDANDDVMWQTGTDGT